jgi:hypothetical protein
MPAWRGSTITASCSGASQPRVEQVAREHDVVLHVQRFPGHGVAAIAVLGQTPSLILSESATLLNLDARRPTRLSAAPESGLNHPPAPDLCKLAIFHPAPLREVLLTW